MQIRSYITIYITLRNEYYLRDGVPSAAVAIDKAVDVHAVANVLRVLPVVPVQRLHQVAHHHEGVVVHFVEPALVRVALVRIAKTARHFGGHLMAFIRCQGAVSTRSHAIDTCQSLTSTDIDYIRQYRVVLVRVHHEGGERQVTQPGLHNCLQSCARALS
jgi:hypothetical protein